MRGQISKIKRGSTGEKGELTTDEDETSCSERGEKSKSWQRRRPLEPRDEWRVGCLRCAQIATARALIQHLPRTKGAFEGKTAEFALRRVELPSLLLFLPHPDAVAPPQISSPPPGGSVRIAKFIQNCWLIHP